MVDRARRSARGVLRLVALCLGLIVVIQLLAAFGGWHPSFNPFRHQTVDRSGPSVLKSLTDLEEYHPLSAHFETVVDLEDDTDHLPGWLSGERVVYVGKGDVDAVVDFGHLDRRSVTVSEDGTSVSVSLPAPTLGQPVLDVRHSYVASHAEGVLTRFSGSDLEQRTQVAAVRQMARAAADDTDLTSRAETNTTAMLRGLLTATGFTQVAVTYHS